MIPRSVVPHNVALFHFFRILFSRSHNPEFLTTTQSMYFLSRIFPRSVKCTSIECPKSLENFWLRRCQIPFRDVKAKLWRLPALMAFWTFCRRVRFLGLIMSWLPRNGLIGTKIVFYATIRGGLSRSLESN